MRLCCNELEWQSWKVFRLKPPAEYKYRNYLCPKKPLDEIIVLSASVADAVGRPRTVPELTPADPSLPSCSSRAESVNVNVSRDIVVLNVEVSTHARQHPQPATFF